MCVYMYTYCVYINISMCVYEYLLMRTYYYYYYYYY